MEHRILGRSGLKVPVLSFGTATFAGKGDFFGKWLNWLLQRPSVANVVIGARDEDQLRQNLSAAGWNLTSEQVARLDAVSQRTPVYPYWHQRDFNERNPKPTKW